MASQNHYFRQFFDEPRSCSILIDKQGNVLEKIDNIGLFGHTNNKSISLHDKKVLEHNMLTEVQHLWATALKNDPGAETVEKWIDHEGEIHEASARKLNGDDTMVLLTVRKRYKMLESVLHGKESEYLKLMNSAGIGILLVDQNLKLLQGNERALKFLGYSLEELFELTIKQITNHEDWVRQSPMIDKLKKGVINKYDIEKRFLTKSGKEKWARVTATPIEEGGETRYFLVSLINIDENKHTLNKLEETKEMYEALFNQAPVGIVVHQEGKVKFANEETLRMINCRSFEELKGREINDFIHPDDKPAVNKRIQQMIEENKVVKLEEERLIRMDGSVIVAVGNASRVKYYGEPSVQAIFNDITEKKEIEARLWREKEKSEQYLNVASAVIVVLDHHGKIDRVNKKGQKVLGYNQEELLGKSWFETIAPTDLSDQYKKKFHSVMRKGEVLEYYEGYVVTKEGKRRLIGWYSSVFTNDINNTRQLIISGQDITDQKRIELERMELIKKQEQHNKELQEFTYVVSHNLRSPVSSIMGLVEYISSLPGNNADLKRSIDKLYGTSRELDIVIEDLNEILAARKGGKDPKDFIYLDEVIESVMKVLGPEIELSHATVNIDLPEDASIYGIKSYLTNIVFNLIQNALKYGNEDAAPVINISARQQNEQMVLEVEDNGLGMDLKKNTDQVFKLYQRFHSHKEGKGMGLYLVKSQVEAMDGKIDFESQVGEGTTFYVTLPIYEPNMD